MVIVVLVAAGVVGGVLYAQHQKNETHGGPIPAKTVAGSTKYPQVLDKANATVLVGKPTAKVTIDAYEDFECPICKEFEALNFGDIEKQLEAGTLQVRYHMINLLDANSSPPGYSSLAANTALAVATVAPDKFMDFHYSLYQTQPTEGKAGWTQDQLTNLANRLGVSGAAFDKLINDGTYKAQINKNMEAAPERPVALPDRQQRRKGLRHADHRLQRQTGQLPDRKAGSKRSSTTPKPSPDQTKPAWWCPSADGPSHAKPTPVFTRSTHRVKLPNVARDDVPSTGL